MRSVSQIWSIERRVIRPQLLGREHPGLVDLDPRPASRTATSPGRFQPSAGPLLNEPPLELSQSREDVEDQLTRSARGVDHSVADRSEPDSTFTKLFDELHQVRHRSAQAVESPNEQRVPAFKNRQASVQSRAARLRSGDLVREDEAPFDAVRDERIDLKREILVVCANSRVSYQATVGSGLDHGLACR